MFVLLDILAILGRVVYSWWLNKIIWYASISVLLQWWAIARMEPFSCFLLKFTFMTIFGCRLCPALMQLIYTWFVHRPADRGIGVARIFAVGVIFLNIQTPLKLTATHTVILTLGECIYNLTPKLSPQNLSSHHGGCTCTPWLHLCTVADTVQCRKWMRNEQYQNVSSYTEKFF